MTSVSAKKRHIIHKTKKIKLTFSLITVIKSKIFCVIIALLFSILEENDSAGEMTVI